MKVSGTLLGALAACAATFWSTPAAAQMAAQLGTAQTYAVLAGTTVTNTGATVVTGDVGVSPGSAIVGFPPGVIVSGAPHAGDSSAATAQVGATALYNALAGSPSTVNLTGQNLGGLTLTPGVYSFATSAQLTGVLTLNALGNPNAEFIFQIGSTLTTASNSAVLLINSASPCNVFWQVGSSATLGTNTVFAGNVVALTSITLNTGASVSGRALALNGAVTLDTNTVTGQCLITCPTITAGPSTLPGGTVGAAYSQTIVPTGGTAPYSVSVTSGTLPTGLSLSTAGLLSGTPTGAGTFVFTIGVTDLNACPGTVVTTLIIVAATPPAPGCPAITITPATLPVGAVGSAYSQALAGNGGSGPYQFGVTSGTLPAGITLSAGGVLSGTPTATGSAGSTIRATDANACFGEAPFTFSTVAAVPTLPQVFIVLLAASLVAAGYLRLRRRSLYRR